MATVVVAWRFPRQLPRGGRRSLSCLAVGFHPDLSRAGHSAVRHSGAGGEPAPVLADACAFTRPVVEWREDSRFAGGKFADGQASSENPARSLHGADARAAPRQSEKAPG